MLLVDTITLVVVGVQYRLMAARVTHDHRPTSHRPHPPAPCDRHGAPAARSAVVAAVIGHCCSPCPCCGYWPAPCSRATGPRRPGRADLALLPPPPTPRARQLRHPPPGRLRPGRAPLRRRGRRGDRRRPAAVGHRRVRPVGLRLPRPGRWCSP
ncbi:hypothetical protein LV779_24740 [Streptomyces thinghirensis]|nr:hypothetical protein [Streptomyces thinghirensis]